MYIKYNKFKSQKLIKNIIFVYTKSIYTMHTIKSNKEKPSKRYEGLKGKLIHLKPKTFNLLNTCAKIKNMDLKEYIERLCDQQALHEATSFITAQSQKK